MFWFWKQQDPNFQLTVDGQVKDRTWVMRNMETYFQRKLNRQVTSSYLNKHSIIKQDDNDRIYYSDLLKKWKQHGFNAKEINLKQNQIRALGCLAGLSIGDALGASTQFQPYDKARKYWIENDFEDLKKCIQHRQLYARHGQIGIWTDDCSMALSMSNSLILSDYKFDPLNIRYMFHLWLKHGLGNGGRSHSIGLGGNISMSMSEFQGEQKQFTQQGNQLTSGNGSLMRLAPIPIAFKDNLEQALKNARLSSLTTHKGQQAAECCRLLTNIIVQLINRKDKDWRLTIEEACENFTTPVDSVKYLAMSKQQTKQMYQEKCQKWQSFEKVNHSVNDRNWNWKDPKFEYSPCRAKKQPGYVGSYSMDALSMALHTVWHKNTFKQMILWSVNMGGDCDTVGAIVGQIAGSIFGFNEEVFHLYSQMQDFTKNRFEIFLHGVKLATHRKLNQKEQLETSAEKSSEKSAKMQQQSPIK